MSRVSIHPDEEYGEQFEDLEYVAPKVAKTAKKPPRPYETIQSDLIMGKKNEQKLLSYLNSLPENANNQFGFYKNKFSTFDFVNDNTIAELKSRRVPCMKYHDTMIGYNKLKICEEDHPDHVGGAEYVFYFLFTDGLYKWDYHKDQFQVKSFFHRDKQYCQDYGYIPVSHLQLVNPSMRSF